MKTIMKSIVPGFLLAALATPGLAENRQGTYAPSTFAGGYLLDPAQRDERRPIFGLRGGYNFTEHWGAEATLGYSLTETKEQFGSRETDIYRYSLDALYHIRPKTRLVPFVAAGVGGSTFNTPNTTSMDDSSAALLNYGAGLKYFVASDVALRGDVRHAVFFHNIGLANEVDMGNNNLEASVGLAYMFGGKKRPFVADLDTIAPTVACTSPDSGVTGVAVDRNINATFSEELDRSTITNSTFTVKQGPTPVAGKVTFNGSNAAVFNPVSDLKTGTTYTATIGTEVKDRAGNGLKRISDSSNSEREPATGVSDPAGNPLANNYVWSFTTVPAPRAAAPPLVLVVLEDNNFDFDKSDVTPEAGEILNDHIRILKSNPKVRIRIAGYTSAMGTEEYNQKLSERRADAVRTYLIKGGIAPDRLEAIGYGRTRPAEYEPVPEHIYSKAARANMRVLFEVIVK